MPHIVVKPVVDPSVRGLCTRPYPLHPKGCPNFDKKAGCPPRAPKLGEYFDLNLSCFVVYNKFPLYEHVRRMRRMHSEWSERQLYCCLYWQPRARSVLELEIVKFRLNVQGAKEMLVARCPEAMGLNVTATMKSIGVDLEWPPVNWVVQVALAGFERV